MEKKRLKVASQCGDGMKRTLAVARVTTPIGEMILKVCPVGLHMIYQISDISDANFSPDPRTPIKLLSDPPEEEKTKLCLDHCLKWLSTYFHEVENISKLSIPVLCPIAIESSQFKDRVLSCLAVSVPVGATITYGKLAALAGSPGAQQAVGSTMAANPFQLIVPCHRVVKSGLKVGKYSGGHRNLVKIWLLQHEGFSVERDGTVSSSASVDL